MAPKEMTDKLINLSKSLGADFIGIADSKGFLNPEYQGNKPQDIMENCKSIVIVGVTIPNGCFEPLPKGRAEYTNTLMAGTATLRIIGFKLLKFIEELGYIATLAPSEGSEFGYWYADKETLKADFSMKYACYLSGIGKFGLNHLVITDKFGPRVRMAAIITDAPFVANSHSSEFIDSRCKNCNKCIDVCPVSALSRDGTIQRQKCRDYMFNDLGGLRCGMCIKVCPL